MSGTAKLSWRETADCLAWQLEDAELQIHGMKEEIVYLRSIIHTYDAQQLFYAQQHVEGMYRQDLFYQASLQYDQDFPPLGGEQVPEAVSETPPPEAEPTKEENEVVAATQGLEKDQPLDERDVPITPVKKGSKTSSPSKKKISIPKTDDQLIEEAIQEIAMMPTPVERKILSCAGLFMPDSPHHQSPFKMMSFIFRQYLSSSSKDVFFTLQAPKDLKKIIEHRIIKENLNIKECASLWNTAATFWFAELGVFSEALHEVMISTFVHISASMCQNDVDRIDFVVETFSCESKIKEFHQSIPDDHPYKDLLRMWLNLTSFDSTDIFKHVVSLFRTKKYLEAQAKLRTLNITTDVNIFTCMDLEKKYRAKNQPLSYGQCVTLRWCKAMASMVKSMELFAMICISCIDGIITSSRHCSHELEPVPYEYPSVTFSSLFKRQMSFIQLHGAEPFSTITTLDQALSMVDTQDNNKPALSLSLYKITKGSLFEK